MKTMGSPFSARDVRYGNMVHVWGYTTRRTPRKSTSAKNVILDLSMCKKPFAINDNDKTQNNTTINPNDEASNIETESSEHDVRTLPQSTSPTESKRETS
jgi:hypothetical protein